MDSIIFRRIKELCTEHDITVTKLESMMGFSQSTIGKWKSAMPAVDKLVKVAQYFNVTMDYLTGLSNAKTKDCELSAICDYLGLDEASVMALRSLRQIDNWNDVLPHFLTAVTIMTEQRFE